jgi:hypothetical protein
LTHFSDYAGGAVQESPPPATYSSEPDRCRWGWGYCAAPPRP